MSNTADYTRTLRRRIDAALSAADAAAIAGEMGQLNKILRAAREDLAPLADMHAAGPQAIQVRCYQTLIWTRAVSGASQALAFEDIENATTLVDLADEVAWPETWREFERVKRELLNRRTA